MRILLVDDDTSVLRALLPVLRSLPGHEVRASTSAEEALETAAATGGIDLLITDVVMEPMDGFTLSEQMQALYEGMRTIFVSGFDLADYPERTASWPVLTKPMEMDVLAAAIEKESISFSDAAAVAAQRSAGPRAVASKPAQAVAPRAVPAEGQPRLVPVATPRAVAAPKAVAAPPQPTVRAAAPAQPQQPTVRAAAPAQPQQPTVRAAAPAQPQQPTVRAAAPAQPQQPTVRAAAPAQPQQPTVRAAAPAQPQQPTVRAAAPAQPQQPTVRAAAPAQPQQPTVRAAAPAQPQQPTVRAAAPAQPQQPTVRAAAPAQPQQPAVRAVAPAQVQQPTVRAAAPAQPQPPTVRAAAPVQNPPTASPVAKARVATPSAVQPRAVAQTPVAPPRPSEVSAPPTRLSEISSQPNFESNSVVEEQSQLTNHQSQSALIGGVVGGYQILSQLGEGRWGGVYAAVQTAINRPVGLKILDPERAHDEAHKQRFIADARAKAHVQHPSILSVYEAGAADGWIFYTREYVDGQNLAEMCATGRTIDEITALKVLKVAAEGLLYLSKNNVPHAALQPDDIYLGIDGHPRLANLAAQASDQQLTVEQEIEVLGQAVWAALQQPVSSGLQLLLARTQPSTEGAITAWGALLQGAKALEPKIVPVEAAKISAQERAASAAAEKARKAQKRAFYLNLASMVSLAAFAGWAVWYYLLRSNERTLDQQIHIAAGDFIFGESQTVSLPEFWIDKYEVTIGQYAKFVDWINLNAGEEHAYDHEKQPKQLSHVPQYWDIYYKNAVAGKAAHSAPIDLNCPVMTVTWWDAYAYAKWKGRQLPTEQEWERAGRGTDGRAYPWGEEPDTKKANTGADFQPASPGAFGSVDGFNFWGAVDKQKYDKSPDGVIGLAGNVSEWTGTWNPENTKPIVKGGNFSVPLKRLAEREMADPSKKEEFIGFRTVTHKAPGAP